MGKAKSKSSQIQDLVRIEERLLAGCTIFLQEAIRKSQVNEISAELRALSVVDLVHCFELMIKARLARVHPAFVLEDIESTTTVVGVRKALTRLQLPQLGKLKLDERECKEIENAIDLRNTLIHQGHLQHPIQYLDAKFYEMLAFVVHFLKVQCGRDVRGGIIDEVVYDAVTSSANAQAHRLTKARREVHGLDPSLVCVCVFCQEETVAVVTSDVSDSSGSSARTAFCHYCHAEMSVEWCLGCGQWSPEGTMGRNVWPIQRTVDGEARTIDRVCLHCWMWEEENELASVRRWDYGRDSDDELI